MRLDGKIFPVLRGGFGANFIIKWESVHKVTEPLIEAIHSGASGTHGYTFASRGSAIKGVNE